MEFSFSSGPSTAGKDLKRSGFGTGLAETNVVLWFDPWTSQIFPPGWAAFQSRNGATERGLRVAGGGREVGFYRAVST
jgi:hypothetical protein